MQESARRFLLNMVLCVQKYTLDTTSLKELQPYAIMTGAVAIRRHAMHVHTFMHMSTGEGCLCVRVQHKAG